MAKVTQNTPRQLASNGVAPIHQPAKESIGGAPQMQRSLSDVVLQAMDAHGNLFETRGDKPGRDTKREVSLDVATTPEFSGLAVEVMLNNRHIRVTEIGQVDSKQTVKLLFGGDELAEEIVKISVLECIAVRIESLRAGISEKTVTDPLAAFEREAQEAKGKHPKDRGAL